MGDFFGNVKDPQENDAQRRATVLRFVVDELTRQGGPKTGLDPERLRIAICVSLDLALGGRGTQESLKSMTAFPPEIAIESPALSFAEAINVPGALDFLVDAPPAEPERPKDPQGALEALSEALPALAATGAGSVTIDFSPNQNLFAVVATDPEVISDLRKWCGALMAYPKQAG